MRGCRSRKFNKNAQVVVMLSVLIRKKVKSDREGALRGAAMEKGKMVKMDLPCYSVLLE
jgi:hypothetical protein